MTVAEVITVERRRRWKLAEKRQLVAEALEPGASVSEVAKRHGLHPSQLFAWKKQLRDGGLNDEAIWIGASEPAFAPVVVRPELPATAEPATQLNRTSESSGPAEAKRGRMEIALRRGCRITVVAHVDDGALARVPDVFDRRSCPKFVWFFRTRNKMIVRNTHTNFGQHLDRMYWLDRGPGSKQICFGLACGFTSHHGAARRSAISRRIRNVEDDSGTALFIREKGSVIA